jgi:hypothetical protein
MVKPQHRDQFTLAYHKQALCMARQDAKVISRVQATLTRWQVLRSNSPIHPCYPAWSKLLESSVDFIENTVCVETEFAAEMRKNSPFAGVLPPEQRLALLQQFLTP